MGMIRCLRPEDMEDSIRLSQFAFQYELTPEELRMRLERLKPEESWGVFLDDGALAAKLTILPLETYLGGEKIAMGGIAGVATWPEHRREGHVSRLLTHALSVMKERGQSLSFLHPFQFEFYRRFGWETYTEYKQYELNTVQLPRFPPEGGRVEREPGRKLLAALYEDYARRFNGSLARSDEWWDWNILALKNKGGTSAVYRSGDGTPKGYMLYKVRDRVMTVSEFAALDGEAYRGLWSFIANHDSMIDNVRLQMEAGDRLASLLKDPRIKQETVPYFMARLVDVNRFLSQYRFREGVSARLSIYVADPHAPWNEGYYEWAIAPDGRAAVTFRPASGRTAAADADLSCGTGTLASMLLGYERPRFWYDNGRLTGSERAAELLESAVPERRTCLLDFF